MSDDAFQLTSHDVRAQEFQRVLRGFDTAQVEEFKQRMAEEIDRLVRDRIQLDERIKGMSEQLKSYRDRDRAMNDALISAQQLRAETQAQVEREREVILREAQGQADQMLLEARTEVERLLQQGRGEEQRLSHGNDLVRRQFQAYVAGYRQLLERQLADLATLDGESADAAADDLQRAYRRQA
ncbi:MAG TPA: DivIVA domain-containing protein [Gemmatimonadales bacterium]|nr:DivIVA domain-containing protein [Gemmatimonadales bacterium]